LALLMVECYGQDLVVLKDDFWPLSSESRRIAELFHPAC